jgi:hypothetical protein
VAAAAILVTGLSYRGLFATWRIKQNRKDRWTQNSFNSYLTLYSYVDNKGVDNILEFEVICLNKKYEHN